MATKQYPKIKKVFWRFARVFASAALVNFGAMLSLIDAKKILGDSLAVSPAVFLKALWGIAIYPAILSAIIAGLAALGKAIREYYGDKNFNSKVHKLPF